MPWIQTTGLRPPTHLESGHARGIDLAPSPDATPDLTLSPGGPPDLIGAGALIAASVLGMVGSVLPWISLGGPGAATVTTYLEAAGVRFGGLDRNGAATIVFFMAAFGLGVARGLGRLPRAAPRAGGALAVCSALAVLAVLADIDDLARDYRDTMGANTLTAAPAFGWWVTLVASVGLLAAAALTWARAGR